VLRRLIYYFKFLKSLFLINVRLLWGVWKLTKLPQPAVTIFGGSKIKADSKHAKMATSIAKMLVDAGFSIVTGGGPGIMEAANRGAIEYIEECKLGCDDNKKKMITKRLVSGSVGLINLNKEKVNPYVQRNIFMGHFFTRKWLLVRYSVGFVVFPGGFGTLDELSEIVTLIQCEHMPRYPIILMDSKYWAPIIEWIEKKALKNGLVSKKDSDLFKIVDRVEEAFEIINKVCKRYKK
jgi:uncharacterized protein (TIGR00730 family)